MPEPGESAVDAAAIAGRGLGLVVLTVQTWKVLAQGLSYHDDWWTKVPAISRMVSVSSGCEWPSTIVIMPEDRS